MLILLIFVFILQLAFLILFWHLPKPTLILPEEQLPFISVLICAKNEQQNLQEHLPIILQQNYPSEKWELLVVNDASDDATAAILEEFRITTNSLKIISIDKNAERIFPGKKHALIDGLRNCKHNAVLLTDADCKPVGKDWIRKMAAAYLLKKKQCSDPVVVLGYGAYEKKSGLLNAFIRWETLHTFIQYASWAMKGLPYMGVGRNLLYEKSAVLNLIDNDHSFKSEFAKTPSGDDDLIVARLSHKRNTAVIAEPDSKTISKTPDSWSSWFRQKTRHVSTGKYYQPKIKLMLGIYALSTFIFWVLFFDVVLCNSSINSLITALVLMLTRSFIFFAVEGRWRNRLKEARTFWLFGDIIWTVYNVFLSPYIFWKNKKQWK